MSETMDYTLENIIDPQFLASTKTEIAELQQAVEEYDAELKKLLKWDKKLERPVSVEMANILDAARQAFNRAERLDADERHVQAFVDNIVKARGIAVEQAEALLKVVELREVAEQLLGLAISTEQAVRHKTTNAHASVNSAQKLAANSAWVSPDAAQLFNHANEQWNERYTPAVRSRSVFEGNFYMRRDRE